MVQILYVRCEETVHDIRQTNGGEVFQAGGAPRRPDEGPERRGPEPKEPDSPSGEGDEPPPRRAGGPEGGQRPLPQQHHEEPGGATESAARPEGETAQGCVIVTGYALNWE